MKPLLRAGAWLCLALMAGCAGTELRPPAGQPVAAPFDLSGRVVVRGRDEHGFAGALRWERHAQSDEIWLSTPLGQSFAHLQAGAGGAVLTTADGKQYRAASVESLTRSAFGWRFPLAPLRYWVRGAATPNLPQDHVARDYTGRLTQLTQGSWRVAFSYAQDSAVTPARIDVTGTAAEIRLVIDRFEPLPP